MKKFILSTIATVLMFIGVSTTANAQKYYKDPVQAFENCKMYVQEADDQYAAHMFVDAKANYKRALNCNASCPDKKFMSDRKINKRIKKCDYAIAHGGVTREEKTAQVLSAIGAVLSVGAAVGEIAVASTSSSHHDAPHHEHHHHHNHVIVEAPQNGNIAEMLRESHR